MRRWSRRGAVKNKRRITGKETNREGGQQGEQGGRRINKERGGQQREGKKESDEKKFRGGGEINRRDWGKHTIVLLLLYAI